MYLLLEGEKLEDSGHGVNFRQAEPLKNICVLVNDFKDALGLRSINVRHKFHIF